LYLQPGIGSFAGLIRAAALLRHDAFKTDLLNRLQESGSVFAQFTRTIRGVLLNGVLKPLAPAGERLINNRPSVQVQAIEEVTDHGILGLRAFDRSFGLLLEPMDYVPEIRFSIRFEADNFSVE